MRHAWHACRCFATSLGGSCCHLRSFDQNKDRVGRRVLAPSHSRPQLVCLACCGAQDVRAEFKVRSPNIDYGEIEIEHNLSVTFDKRADKNHDISSPVEVGVGLLPFWKLELEGEIERHPGENTQWEATTIENYFMLTEPGKYWLDVALFAEFARATNRDEPNTVELGLLVRKEHMNWLHTLNLFWEKQVGSKAEPIDTVSYAWQSRYRLNQYFQPGIEFYGEIEDVNNAGSISSSSASARCSTAARAWRISSARANSCTRRDTCSAPPRRPKKVPCVPASNSRSHSEPVEPTRPRPRRVGHEGASRLPVLG